MELKATLELTDFPPSVYGHDSEEEFGDDDDVRSHTDHIIEAQSDSLDKDAAFDQVVTMPINLPSKRLKSVVVFQDNKFQRIDQCKNANAASFDTNVSAEFEKVDTGMLPYPPVCLDPSQTRANIWGDYEPAISQRIDVGQRGPTLLPRMWMPNIANLQVASGNNTFGVIPDGSQDTRYPISLQGTFMTPVNLDFSLPRQQCKDFEEQGYCLRGDMCPMEHGVNRIVIEDPQCLSQFNLPFSISTANLRRKPTVKEHPAHTIIIPTTNDKGVNGESDKGTDGTCSNDVHGVDSYDPDQPLWTESSIFSENEKLSVWDRIECSKGEDRDQVHNAMDPETKTNKNQDSESKAIDFSSKIRNDTIRFPRKQNLKADQTLYVIGIPQQANKLEPLLSHFKKFGEVVHITIPVNSDHAFIQFSKREEAEAALEAPDAVMGNRFIKLRWAHYDCITRDGIIARSNAHELRTGSVTSYTKSVSCSRKDSLHHGTANAKTVQNSAAAPLASDKSKSVCTNNAKALHPLKNKRTSLEQLKRDFQQKQKILDQKRQDFKQQIEKLEKQSSGIKDKVMASRAKRQRLVPTLDCGKLEMSISSDTDLVVLTSCNSTDAVVKGSQCLKQETNPSPCGTSSAMNKLQLDNRPTTFKIIPPLPSGLCNGDAIKEHFASYGDVSLVQLQNADNCTTGCQTMRNCSALIKFTSRESAEKAFANGKCWKGHFLQFLWEKRPNESSG